MPFLVRRFQEERMVKDAISFRRKQRNIESLSSGLTFMAIVFAFYFSVIGLFSTGAICFGRGHRGQWKRIDSHVIKTFYLAFVKFFPSFRLLTLQAAQS